MQSSSRGEKAAHPFRTAFSLRALLLLLPALCLLAPTRAHAYPWLIKHNYSTSCGECHADPSGGELLTGYGRAISMMVLSTNWDGEGSARNQHGLERKLALRSPVSFAAGAKWATPEGDEEAGDAAAEGEAAEGEATEGEATEGEAAKPEGEGEAAKPEADAAAAPAEASASSGGGSSDPTFFNAFFGLIPLPDWLLLGGSYRHLNILPVGDRKFSTFPMMMDLYGQAKFGGFLVGGSLGAARVAVGSPYARRAQVTANQGKEFNLISRTHYVGYEILPGELFVRAGRLNLPFGVRIPEHIMWVRQATNTDRESSQQHGVAVAYNAPGIRAEVMGIAGNYQISPDKYRERGYSGYVEYSPTPAAAFGVSSLMTSSATDRATYEEAKTVHQVHGVMGRLGFAEKVAVLAEFDGIFTSRREAGYVGFTQVDVEPMQGVHFMLTGEMLDEGHSKAPDAEPRAPGSGKPRLGGWLSAAWFFYSHFDVRFDAIKRTEEDVQLLAQLHCYL